MDRIQDLEISRKKFKYAVAFNVAELYKNSFGIINPIESEREEIILSFDADQGKYLKSFPLHASQRNLIDNEEELRISLKLHITHDFIMEVLSYGDRVEVISPDSLKKEIMNQYRKALSYYS